jgi:tetratricopeptide (TPR) repeat protein
MFRVLVCTVVLISVLPCVGAQSGGAAGDAEAALPRNEYGSAWLEYEAAEAAARNREFSVALRGYARALENRPIYPEAFVGMAQTYKQLQDYSLAERYYRRALEHVSQLQIPADRYAIYIEMAQMYDGLRGTGEYERRYRDTLLTVIQDDPTFSGNEPPGQREAMRSVLFRDGINRVVVLYRLDFPATIEAHRLYGRYLLETPGHDEWVEAVEHFLFVVVEIAGRAVDAIIERQFDYEFTTMVDLYRTAMSYPSILNYLRSEEFIAALHDLSAALARLDTPEAQRARAGVEREIQTITNLSVQ